MTFHHDPPDIHEVYDVACELTPEALAVWSTVLTNYLPDASIERIVDLEYGVDRFSILLRDLFSATVYGIDLFKSITETPVQNGGRGGVRFVRAPAESLPLRKGVADLLFLSMVYHHLPDKQAALSECARALRRGRYLMIQTATLENVDSYRWMRFFPTGRAIESERLPSRSVLIETVRRAGFQIRRRSTVPDPFARGLLEYAEKIGRRELSTLRLIPEKEFEAGFNELKRWCATEDRGQSVRQDIDLFLFQRG